MLCHYQCPRREFGANLFFLILFLSSGFSVRPDRRWWRLQLHRHHSGRRRRCRRHRPHHWRHLHLPKAHVSHPHVELILNSIHQTRIILKVTYCISPSNCGDLSIFAFNYSTAHCKYNITVHHKS